MKISFDRRHFNRGRLPCVIASRVAAMALILVIDDDPAMRRLVRRVLAGRHRLIEAENGAEGLRLRAQHQPDLIVTDILMPQKEGIETMREVKQLAPATKIIAISGGVAPNLMYLDMARSLGADAVLAKPFRPAELSDTVERLLSSVGEAGRWATRG